MAEIKCTFPSWEKIHDECKKVAKQVVKSGYKPDVVVALSRGGFIPARTICDLLVIKDLISIKVDHWGITATKDGKARLRYPVDADLAGKKALIVDDITDTGESLSLATKWIRENLKPQEIRTATIYHITHSKFTPDYAAEYIPKENWVWVVWPWNFVEDMCNLLPKIINGRMDFEKLKKIFEIEYSVRIQDELFKEALSELEAKCIIKQNPDGTWEGLAK